MRHVSACLGIVAAISIGAAAHAERRVALVIGNSSYQNTAELKNSTNDAADVAAALRRLGFDVSEGSNLDKRAMEHTIRDFGVKLGGADVALFFYAGHGLQVGGQNFLLPTDARLASEGDVDFEALPLVLVLKQMEREAKTSVVLLDACRDNPLAKNLARSMGTRSSQVGQGLAEVRAGVGTLIGFSTQPGNVAFDGEGRNSPYAAALLKHAETPAMGLSAMFAAVRNDVLQATGGRQVPWEHTSLTGEVFLNPQPASSSVTTSSIPSYDKEMEIAFWNAVKDSKSPAVLQTYLDRFPGGTFAGLARVLIDQLKNEQGGKVAGGSARVANLSSQSQVAKLPDVSATDPHALARALQTELKRVGCDPGSVDGEWTAKSKAALGKFVRLSKIKVPTDEPSELSLQAVAGQKGRICPLECARGETEANGRCVAKSRGDRHVVEQPRGSASREGPKPRVCVLKFGVSFCSH
jgi:hypothetical protein